MKTFPSLKCKIYPHENLNTTKGVIRNWELSLATPEDIQTDLGKQGVTNQKKITISEEIQTQAF